MASELMEHYRSRLAVVEAVLAAQERRAEVMEAVAASANTQAARDAVGRMLACEPRAAQVVVDLRVSQFSEFEIERTKEERRTLIDAIRHLQENPGPGAWGCEPQA